jgi:hypothetical protein
MQSAGQRNCKAPERFSGLNFRPGANNAHTAGRRVDMGHASDETVVRGLDDWQQVRLALDGGGDDDMPMCEASESGDEPGDYESESEGDDDDESEGDDDESEGDDDDDESEGDDDDESEGGSGEGGDIFPLLLKGVGHEADDGLGRVLKGSMLVVPLDVVPLLTGHNGRTMKAMSRICGGVRGGCGMRHEGAGRFLLMADTEVYLRQLRSEIGRRFLGDRRPLTAAECRAPPPVCTYEVNGAKRRRLT